ncbi:hypothetical protein BGX28_009543, partial [Mortierella sp. GBA30]
AIRSKEIGNDSSSQYLMDPRPDQHRLINDPKPGQPANVLPSFLLRGMVVTIGRSLHLSAVGLRLRSGQRFVTKLVNSPDDERVYRHHALAPILTASFPVSRLPSLIKLIPLKWTWRCKIPLPRVKTRPVAHEGLPQPLKRYHQTRVYQILLE